MATARNASDWPVVALGMPDDPDLSGLTAEQYRERAKLVRNLAEGVRVALLRQDPLDVADEYERCAETADTSAPTD